MERRQFTREFNRVAISNRRLISVDEAASPSSGRTTGSKGPAGTRP
jgi:hypothetical protein